MDDAFFNQGDQSEKLIVRIPRNRLYGLENLWKCADKVRKKKKRKGGRKKREDVWSRRLRQLEDKIERKTGKRTMNEEERNVDEGKITHFKKRIIRNHSVASVYSTSPHSSDDDKAHQTWPYKTKVCSPEVSCGQTIQQGGPTDQIGKPEQESSQAQQNFSLGYSEQDSEEPINYSSRNLSNLIESSVEGAMKEKDMKNVGKHQLPTVVMPTNIRTSGRPTISRRLSLGEPLLNRMTSPTNQPQSAPIIDQREHPLQNQLVQNQLAQNQMTQNQLAQNHLPKKKLTQNQLTQNQLTQNQLTQNQLTQNQLTQNQLTQNHLPQTQLTQNQLTQNHLPQNQLTQNQLTQNQLTQNQLTQNQLTQNQLTQNQLTQNQLTQNPLTQNRLTQNQLSQNQLSQNQLSQNQLTQNQLTQSQLTQSQLTQNQLTQNQLTQNQLTQNPLTQNRLTQNRLIQNQLSQNQLSQNQLSQNQLTQNQLIQNQLTQNQLTQNQLTQNPLTQNQLTQNRLTQNQLSQNQLSQNELSQNQLTQSQLTQNQLTQNRLTQNLFSQNQLSQNQLTQSQLTQNQLTQNQLTQNQLTHNQMVQNQMAQRPEASLVVDIQLPKVQKKVGTFRPAFPNQFPNYPYANQPSRYSVPMVPQGGFMDYYRGNQLEKRTMELNHLHQQIQQMETNRNQLRYSTPAFNQRAPPAYTEVSHTPEVPQYPHQNPFLMARSFDRRIIPQTVVSPQASMLPPNISPSIPQAHDRVHDLPPEEKTEELKLNIYDVMERECAKVLNNFYEVMDTIHDSERSRKNNSSSRAYFYLAMNKISSKVSEIENFLNKCNEFAEKSESNHDEHHIFYSLLDCMKDFTARIRTMVNKARNNQDRKRNLPLISNVEENFYKNVFYRMYDYITSNSSAKSENKDSKQETSPNSDDNLSTINCIIFKQQEMKSANGNMIVMPLVGQCPNRCCLNEQRKCPNQQKCLESDEEESQATPPTPEPVKKPDEKVLKRFDDPVLERIEKELELMEGKKPDVDEVKPNDTVDDKAETMKQIREIECKQKPKYKISEILCIEIDSECDSSDEKIDIKKEPVGDSILKRKLEETGEFEVIKKVKSEVEDAKDAIGDDDDDDVILVEDHLEPDNLESDNLELDNLESENLEDDLEEKFKEIENSWKTPPSTFKMQFPNTVISDSPDTTVGNEEILVVDKGNGRQNQQTRRNSSFSERIPTNIGSSLHSIATGEPRDLKKSFSTPADFLHQNTATKNSSNDRTTTDGVLNLSNSGQTTTTRNEDERRSTIQSPELSSQKEQALEEVVTSPKVPVFPKLGSIYDETVKTDGFVSQIIKEQISCLSKKEALNAQEYVKEVETLQEIVTLPDEFKEFYIYITKVQILHKHNPIAFRLFLELLNQGGLIDYHKKFSEYVSRKRIINKNLSETNKSRRHSIKNK